MEIKEGSEIEAHLHAKLMRAITHLSRFEEFVSENIKLIVRDGEPYAVRDIKTGEEVLLDD